MSKPRTRIEKGKRAEKQVCELIELAGLGEARREAGSGNGKKKGDIFCNLPFLLEVKNQKTIHFTEWIDQAMDQARIGNYSSDKWCLIIKDPRVAQNNLDGFYATIDLNEFLELLKRIKEPKVKAPDRELKYKLESLKTICGQVIKKLN